MINEVVRCPWLDCSKPDYVTYHDTEWGVPVYNDRHIFEHLCLEVQQAGLSWYTILKRRESYRKYLDNFNPEKIAHYSSKKVERLLKNAAIIRNRKKIEAVISNAKAFLSIQEEFGSFSSYMWRFVDGTPLVNTIKSLEDYQATSKESETFSKDLKKRGFSFVGSTICYAHMQAIGMVNDHSLTCFRRKEIIAGYDSK